MQRERLPKNENGVSQWLCPGCAVIISGPGYPKLHTCFKSERLVPLAKQRVAALKKIIDDQQEVIKEVKDEKMGIAKDLTIDHAKDAKRKQVEARKAAEQDAHNKPIRQTIFSCPECGTVHDNAQDQQSCCNADIVYWCPFCGDQWPSQEQAFSCCGG